MPSVPISLQWPSLKTSVDARFPTGPWLDVVARGARPDRAHFGCLRRRGKRRSANVSSSATRAVRRASATCGRSPRQGRFYDGLKAWAAKNASGRIRLPARPSRPSRPLQWPAYYACGQSGMKAAAGDCFEPKTIAFEARRFEASARPASLPLRLAIIAWWRAGATRWQKRIGGP